MNLRHIEYFLAVVEHGGVAKAARACYVAQPSVSQAIQRLSDELGVELFTRVGRNLQLTSAGESFLQSARELMTEISVSRVKMDGIRRGVVGRLNIAATGTLAIDPLVPILSEFFVEHPGASVAIGEPGEDSDVGAAVCRGEYELGLMLHAPQLEGLATFPIGLQESVLVGRPARFEGFEEIIRLDGPGTLPLIGESGDRRRISESNTVLRMHIESSHRLFSWQLVAAGSGVTLMPVGMAVRYIEGVEERRTSPPISEPVVVVARSDEMSALAQSLVLIAQRRARAQRPAV